MSFVNLFRASILGSALCMLTVACGPKAPPPPVEKKAPEPEPVVEPEPEPQPPAPKLDLPPELPPNCDIEVVGERKVVKAAVGTADGQLLEGTTVTADGRTIRIVCPDEESRRKGLAVVAQLEGPGKPEDNIVHWNNVDVGGSDKPGQLDTAEATQGMPPDREDQFAGSFGIDTTPPPPSPPAVIKVKVTFEPGLGRLRAYNVKWSGQNGASGQLPKVTSSKPKKLAPGKYKLEVQAPLDSQAWEDAGSIEIPDHDVRVEFSDKPLRAAVK